MEILCLRHAESENVLAGASGVVPLAPLTERGRAQAAALAGEVCVSRVYASRAVRARQTAEVLDAPVTVLPQLAEMSIGRREGQIDAAFSYVTYNALGYDTVSYPITLRFVPPVTTELAGTWALTSSTGASAVPSSILHDTIIVNGSGGAWRHRDGLYTWDPLIATRAIWARNGSWLVLEHESPDLLFRDSLLIQSGELQRTTVNYYGTRVDHYTRISNSGELP